MKDASLRPTVLDVAGAWFSYGDLEVLAGIDLAVRREEFVALVGPSGCGKSTLLNMAAGSVEPHRGTVQRPARLRMVFQQDGLFPWLTVEENVKLGLRHLRDEGERASRAAALLELVDMAPSARRFPHQLSAGMRQRVELVRALGAETDLVLLDEPFSSLDALARREMRFELARLLREYPRAVVLVTHDVEEAVQLADRVLVLCERPARIVDEVALPRQPFRSAADPVVVNAVQRILADLGLEDGGRSLPAPRRA